MLKKTQNDIMKKWPRNWDEPVVTIRCLVFNHEKYISQALDGFLMQNTDFPFVVFVHDDASNDKSASIIREYERLYPRIIQPIYEKENLYSKMNGSLKKILNSPKYNRGKYIAFCEGDDYWINPHKLQQQISFLEKNNEYFGCVGGSSVLEENTNKIRRREMVYPPFDVPFERFIDGPTVGHTSTIVARKEVLEQVQDAPCVFSGDKVLLLSMKLNGKVAFFQEQYSIYRKHNGGVSRNVTLNSISRDLQIPKWVKHVYEKKTGKKYFFYWRHLSLIYQTIFCYTKDLNVYEKTKYFFLFFLTSFSYFPQNIGRIWSILSICIRGKKFT